MNRRSGMAILMAMLMMVMTAGCSSDHNSQAESSEVSLAETSSAPEISSAVESSSVPQVSSAPEVSSQEESSQTVSVPEGNLNLLSGMYDLTDEAVGKRPIAIMINNIKEALPQYGIAGADIMFEMPVEAGITRMMAIYADYTQIPDVCSVRSCRYYYPIFAAGFDAVYIHVGGSTSGMAMVEQLGIAHFDGTQGDTFLFDRDPVRLQSYALEHTMYVKGANIPQAMIDYGMRTDLEEAYTQTAFSFRLPGDVQSNSDQACEELTVHFSSEYYSTFTYDFINGIYYKQHSGQPHMVQDTNSQLCFTNVLALETNIGSADGYLQDVDCSGGTGYYASNGCVQEIRWQKASAFDRIQIFDEDGQELTMNAGKTYIGVTDYDTVDFE